jgi:DNA modification methylase
MQYRKLTELKKLEKNPRIIRDKQFKTLCDSIRDNSKYFEARPLILSNRTGQLVIIAGNQRYEAAKALKLKEVPTFLIEDLTEDKEKEIVIRDNISNGEFDMDALANSWGDLPLVDWGVDIPEDWLKKEEVSTADAEPQIDRAEELNKTWGVKTGDLWQIGEHRLLCGDSTKKEDVERVMGEEKASATITDPPYSVNYDRSQEERGGSISAHAAYKEADINPTDLLKFMAIIPSDILIFSYPVDRHFFELADSLRRASLDVRKELVWVKDTFSFWMGAKYQQRHEPILVCARKGKPLNANVPANQSTVFEFPRPKAHDIHATAKPIELWTLLVTYHSKEGDSIFEPFTGSGTTMVACQNLNRKCRGIEISPSYCAVILQRMTDAFPGIEIRRIEK